MPTVPEYGNFKVTPTVQPAPSFDLGVDVQQATLGPRGLIRAGEQITQAGVGLSAIEIDAAEQANQLRVDDSLNQLKERSLKLRFDPQTGFQNTRGIDALQRDSGKSLTDEYSEELGKSASDIENRLSNDAQKRAFRLNANNIMTGFRGEAQQHEGREFQSYGLSVREGTIKNRMAEIGLNYNNPEVVDQAVRSIEAATYDSARMLGKSAEWAEAQSREAVSNAHKVAVATALQNNDVSYADGYLKKYAPQMSPDDILAVNGHVTKEMDTMIGTTAATKIIQENGPRISTSQSDRAFNIALGTESNYRQFDASGKPLTSSAGAIGIAQVMPGTAPEAAKLAGLEWDENKYKNDATYNRALGKAYFDKQLKDFDGNLAMSYAAYNAGPGKDTATGRDAEGKPLPGVRPAMARASARGAPEDWLKELPAETQNYVSKNMSSFGNGEGSFAKPTLMELQNAVRAEVGAGNPTRLRVALDEVERQFNSINAAEKQQRDQALADAMRGVLSNGGRYGDLPANLRGALDPQDITKVMDFGAKIARGDDVTNLWLYNNLSTHPENLAHLTDDQFFALRTELSDSDFKHFSNERSKMISGTAPNSPGDLNTDAITRTLNDRLNSMGLDPTPKDGSAEAERVGSVRRFVNQSIAAEQQNRGKKMNDVEVSGFIDTLFAEQNKVITDSFWGSARIARPSDIPSSTKDALKTAFKRHGVDNPTDTDLMTAYWRQMRLIQNAKPKAKTNG